MKPWPDEVKLDALGVLVPLLNPNKLPVLLLKLLFLDVWGWLPNENNNGELTNNLG